MDTTIKSPVLQLTGLYEGTQRITLEYKKDWIIRCYGQDGKKLGTLIPNPLLD